MAEQHSSKNRGNRHSHGQRQKKWVQSVTSDSTHPQHDLFTKDAKTIAEAMATKEVSPKGIGSGIRMVQYFINRAGKNLSEDRRRELEKAKRILQEKREKQDSTSTAKCRAKKKSSISKSE